MKFYFKYYALIRSLLGLVSWTINKTNTIDTVPLVGFGKSLAAKNMTQMPVAISTDDFYSATISIRDLFDGSNDP